MTHLKIEEYTNETLRDIAVGAMASEHPRQVALDELIRRSAERAVSAAVVRRGPPRMRDYSADTLRAIVAGDLPMDDIYTLQAMQELLYRGLSIGHSAVYIRLLNGRDRYDEELEGKFGFDGPVIGPVNLSWVHGRVRLFKLGWGNGFEFIPLVDDLIAYEGKFYGDMEVLSHESPAVKDSKIHNYEHFVTTLATHAAEVEVLQAKVAKDQRLSVEVECRPDTPAAHAEDRLAEHETNEELHGKP